MVLLGKVARQQHEDAVHPESCKKAFVAEQDPTAAHRASSEDR